MGGTNKVEAIKDIIKSERTDILLIQETKMSDVEVLALSHCFWTNNHGKDISSNGASGVIETFFSSKYVIKNVKENQNWLLIEFQEKDDSNDYYVCNVYGPTHYRDKQSFWNSLAALKEDLKGKDLIIVVDFNATKA